jgi:hypothetical protein
MNFCPVLSAVVSNFGFLNRKESGRDEGLRTSPLMAYPLRPGSTAGVHYLDRCGYDKKKLDLAAVPPLSFIP